MVDPLVTPLWRKLGLTPGALLVVLDAPPGLAHILNPLPEGAATADEPRPCDVALAFCTDLVAVAAAWERLVSMLPPRGGLWIAYPKRSSALSSRIGFDDVQRFGLGRGRVDNKSCAVDADWSALRFVVRLRDR